MTATKEHDVFISYRHADSGAAERLEALLRERGLTVWRDQTNQLPGDDIELEVRDALNAAEAVIVLWSKSSATSRWVQFEANVARMARIAIPLRVDDVEISALPSRFHNSLFADLADVLADPTRVIQKVRELRDARVATAPLRRVSEQGLPRTLNKFIARADELDMLRDAWAAGAPKALSFVAAGGAGKTALTRAFLDELVKIGFGGAEAIFAFSFDSQGTDEKRQGSSDRFFSEGLEFFGVDPQSFDTVRKRAAKLAEILQQKRALLILDGVEPMQEPRGDNEHGRFRDDAMREFLIQLARLNRGLCVVTSRLPIKDLAGFDDALAREILLPNLPLEDAVELLRGFGIDYPPAQMEKICRDYGQVVHDPDRPASQDFRCHAKAIAMIGAFLKQRFRNLRVAPSDKEIVDAFAMPDDLFLGIRDEELKKEPGYAVYKMMRRYEILYKERVRAGQVVEVKSQPGRQLLLMRLMGLFDRPASWGAFQAVLAAPPIPGLTDRLDEISEAMWISAINALREDGLFNPTPDGSPTVLDADHELDAHPLIREYFKRRLEVSAPEATREAHRRLYDFYRYQGLPAAFQEKVAYGLLGLKTGYSEHFDMLWNGLLDGSLAEGYRVQIPPSVARADQDALKVAAQLIDGPEWREALTAFLPTDEAGMLPLFAAIAHGCAAARHDEAFQEVYWPRVARGNEGYAVHKLGLYGSELSAVAHFFAEPFAEPADGLPPARQGLLFNRAGFMLRALGRLSEAVAPFRGALSAFESMGDPKEIAVAASNLSELLLVLGRLGDAPSGAAGAVSTAAQSVAYADRSGDAFERMSNRTTHADALHHQGDLAGAARLFEEAEALQRERQPDLPLLYSLPGARWCDLKLAQGRREEAQARAEYALPLGQRNNWLVDIGLNTLTLGRAAHHRAREGASRFPEALALLDRAVEALLAAGTGDQIPKGYLARAACRREAGDAAGAAQDLDAARDIARRGGMRLFLVDCAGEAAWRALEREDLDAASKEIAFVGQEIEAIGCGRRKPDLALLRAALAGAEGDRAALLTHLGDLIETIRRDNLWSIMPDVDRLAEAHGLSELDQIRAEMRDQRARFDAEEDAKFEKARAYPDGLDDDVIDGRLANPNFRARLAAANEQVGLPKLEDVSLERRREMARQFITQIERAQEKQPSKPSVDPASIPDEMVAQALGDAQFRATVDRIHEQMGQPKLAELSPEDQRQAARSVLAAMAAAQQKQEQTREPPEVAPLPDALVDQMLADQGIRDLLARVYRDNNVAAPFEQIPRETHANALAQLVAQGVVQVGDTPQDAAEESAPEPAAPRGPLPPDLLKKWSGVLSRRRGDD